MYGKDYNYAATRISGTIVRIAKDGEPVLVDNVYHNGICTVSHIGKINQDHKEVHLDELDLTPVKLGYINCAGQAAYLMRVPVRRGPNNQGLRAENSMCNNGRRLFGLPMDALRNCILGRYPSFEKARVSSVGKRDEPPKCIAFDRHWAVQGNHLLYKNNLIVGRIENKKPVLDERYKHLRESLSEVA